MPDILPFKGILYNPDKIKDLRRVVTPPYDIITPEQQEMYYKRDEYSMIRLDLNKELPDDTEGNNRYTRSAGYFSKWLSDQILVHDDRPSLYFYELIYQTPDNGQKVMKGFIALCRLEEFGKGKVVPHEYTLSKPKSDRLNLLRSCQANLSFIFSLYSLPADRINKPLQGGIGNTPPKMEVMDDQGYRHRLWSVNDPALIELVKRELKDQTVYIADGHHRYESSLNYKNEVRKNRGTNAGEMPSDYVMMYFANMDEPGLTILPTHRLIYDVPEPKLQGLYASLKRNFLLRDFDFSGGREKEARQQLLEAMKKGGPKDHLFGLYLKNEKRYTLLSLKEEAILSNITSDKPFAWRRLDVSILQTLILEDILGFSEESIRRQENLCYVKDFHDAIEKTGSGAYQAAFLLNSTKIEEIKNVTSTGERMPQKSTYFYPKFLTGLVMYKF